MENPTHISILNKEYEIKPLLYFTKREDNPYVMVDGFPVATIRMLNLVATTDSLKLAEVSIQSFINSGGKHSVSPVSEFSIFDYESVNKVSENAYYESQLKNFDISFLDDPSVRVEEYQIFGVKHLFVFNNERRFCIWDKLLMREVKERNFEKKNSLN